MLSIFLGLDILMFSIVEWSQKHQVFDRSCFSELHLCLLLIQYGLGILPSQLCESFSYETIFLDELNCYKIENEDEIESIDITIRLGGIGRIF